MTCSPTRSRARDLRARLTPESLMIASCAMRAIVVREFGGPDVMQRRRACRLRSPDRVEVLVRVRAAGVNPVDAYIRSRHLRAQADAAVHARHRRRRRSRDGRRGRRPASSPAIASTSPATTITPPAPAPTPSTRSARRRSCIGCRRASRSAQGAAIGVPYATAYRALVHARQRAAGRNRARPRRHRRRRHRRRADRQTHGMRVIGTGGTERGLEVVREHGADASSITAKTAT